MKNTIKLLTTITLISSFSTNSLAVSDIEVPNQHQEVIVENQQNTDIINNDELIQMNSDSLNTNNNLIEENDNTNLMNRYRLNLIEGTWDKKENTLNIIGTVEIETNIGDFLVNKEEILYRNSNNIYKIDANGEILLDQESSSKFNVIESNEIIANIDSLEVVNSGLVDVENSYVDGAIDSNSIETTTENSNLEITIQEQGFVIKNRDNTVSISNNALLNINDQSIILDENLIGEKSNTNLIEEYSLKNNLDALSKEQQQIVENNVVRPQIEDIKETIIAQDEIQKVDTETQEIAVPVENVAITEVAKTMENTPKGEVDNLEIEKQNNKIAEVDKKTEKIDKETQELKNDVIKLKEGEKVATANFDKVIQDKPKTEAHGLEVEKQNNKIEELNNETQSLKDDVIKFKQNEKIAISKSSEPIDIKPKSITSKKIDVKTDNKLAPNGEASAIEGEQIASLNSQDVGNLQVVANPEAEKINSDIFVEVAKVDNPKEALTYCLSPESNFENGQAIASGDYLVKDIYFANQELDDKYSFDYNDVIKSLKGQTTYLRIQIYEGDKFDNSATSISEEVQMNDLVADPLTANLEEVVNNDIANESNKKTSSIVMNFIFMISALIIAVILIERKLHLRKRLIHKDFRTHRRK